MFSWCKLSQASLLPAPLSFSGNAASLSVWSGPEKEIDYALCAVDYRRPDCRLEYRKNHEGAGYSVFMDILIGIAGAIIDGFLMRTLGFAGQGGMIYTIRIAIGGAVLLTAILRFFSRDRSY